MKKYLVGTLIILTLLLVGCKEPTNDEIFYEIQKNFYSMNSYQCNAHIIIKESNTPQSYSAKHIYKKPDKYLIEILQPEESKGFVTAFDGSGGWLYHPGIKEKLTIKNFKGSQEESMFIGYFLKVAVTGEDVKLSNEVIDNNDYLVVKGKIPGNHSYRSYAKLWIDKGNHIPYKLIVYDKEDKESIEVIYSNFKYNVDIDDDVFILKN